jgi:iron complex transport system substrate-binding protein
MSEQQELCAICHENVNTGDQQNDQVYSFTHKVGDTGGLLYFELAPNRPDIVLKDIIKILHPELLPNHNLYFFDQLK